MELAEEMTVKRGSGIQTVVREGKTTIEGLLQEHIYGFYLRKKEGAANTEGG
jgi:hypothetical protein